MKENLGTSKTNGNGQRKAVLRKPVLRALEPRIVFDGAIGEEVTGMLVPALDKAIGPVEVGHDFDRAIYDANGLPLDAALDSAPTPVSPSVSEIVFVDTEVADWQTLIANTRSDVRVVLIDSRYDALAQMSTALEGVQDLDSIHIVSHGGAGEIQFGESALNAGNLDEYSDALARIGSSLSDDGDILLYGCDIAGSASGVEFVGLLSSMTGADVAASTDRTGSNAAGGDWVLESRTGSIESDVFLTREGIDRYANWLNGVALDGQAGWTAVMYGAAFDPIGDSQAGAADTDIVGDASHGSLYVAFEDNGTDDPNDDMIALRLRIDNPTSSTNFGGVAVVGIDANNDGRIDIFFSVDGRNNGQVVRLLDPGTGDNISPNTTSTSPLPRGWIDSNGVYPMSTDNYSVDAVSASNDPHWNGNTDVGGDGKSDIFVSWRVPLKDVAAVLALPSPADRNGTFGPRGPEGISGFGKDTAVRYVGFSQTQTGPINGDLLGVGRDYDKNASFAELGAFTDSMSLSDPVPAGPRILIDSPISGDNVVNQVEDDSVDISGTSEGLNNKTLELSVSDGTSTVTGSTTTDGSGNWTVSGLDLSGLNQGSLSVVASVDQDGNPGTTTDITSASASVDHDSVPPSVAIDQLATAPNGQPTFSGTSDLPDGGVVTVTIDHDNDSGTSALVYQVVVSGSIWSLNTAAVSPVSGTMPGTGLLAYAKVTASVTDAAGNMATDTALTRPTVNSLSTNSLTPTISGTWTKFDGDTLTVAVGGASYTLTPASNTWSLDLSSATPSSGSLNLSTGNTYEVVATVTRGGDSVSDTSTSELSITNDPVVLVGIDGGATVATADTTPALTGTSSNAGGFVIVRLDPGNDGDLSDAVTWSVVTDGSGNWSLDTGVDAPISGLLPSSGFLGDVGVYATDSSGDVSAAQVITVSIPSIAIGSIASGASTDGFGVVSNSSGGEAWLNITEDDSVTISGTATNGFTVDLLVSDANGNVVVSNGLSVSGGVWSASGLDLSGLDNTSLSVTATLSGTSISDTDTSVTHDEIAPRIFITNPSEIKKNGGVVYGVSELPNTSLTVTVRDSGDTTTKWTGTVTTDANGNWTVTTSGNLVSGSSGNVIIKVTPTAAGTTDAAGNIVQEVTRNQYVAANASTESIAIDTIASDDLITVGEIVSGLTLSGTVSLAGSGTVDLDVTDGTTTVSVSGSYSGGVWSADFSQAQIQSLNNGQLTVTASTLDGSIDIFDTAFATLNLPSPTVTITDDTPGSASGPVTFTFTFSEGVTGFTADDIGVTNGTKGTFSAVSATEYTLEVTPANDSSGTIEISVAAGVSNGVDTGRGNNEGSATQVFNTTTAAEPPTLSIDTSNLVSDTTPVIMGATSLSAGAPIVINIDTDNDGVTDLVYFTTVQVGNTWSLNLETATPTSGSFPAGGIDPYARITAIATNAYGNSTTVVGLNTPTVVSQITNDTTPTISGLWTQLSGDTLEVVVDGVTYSEGNGNLVVTATGWSLTPTDPNAISPDGSYDVAATVSRFGGGSTVDITSSELLIDTLATVTISGGESVDITNDPSPVITGVTTGIPAGTVLTIALDVGNDASTEYSYLTVVQSDGSWTLDTATAVPVSGTLPSGGINLSGEVLITASASDPAGNSASDTQVRTVDLTGPVISLTFNPKTTDSTPIITGTTDLPPGSTITVYIDPNHDSDWGDQHIYTTTVNDDGSWSLEATTPLSGIVGVRAYGQDSVGNETTTVARDLEITAGAPSIGVDALPSGVGETYNDSVVDGTEDDSVVLTGTTSNVAEGSTVTVIVTDGSRAIQDTALVQSDGSWSLAGLNLSNFVNGTIQVSASVLDTDGTVYTDSYSFEHDKSNGVSVSIDYINSDTAISSDFITSDQTIKFFGSATANATVTLDLAGPSGTFTGVTVTASNSGEWSYDYTGTTLADGTYTLTATVGGDSVDQAIVIDAMVPGGPVSVSSLTTSDTTPTISGGATVGAGETLYVTVNGVIYVDGDGNLSYNSGANTWSLSIPQSGALTPASSGAEFDGVYEVLAQIKDVAGNVLVDGTSGELTIQDTTSPVIDLDPSDLASTSHTATSSLGAAVSLDDSADEASLVEASDILRQIDITVSGLLDGSDEKLVFGSSSFAADGSDGAQASVSVGGLLVSLVYDSGVFTLQKSDFTNFTTTEAQEVVRDLQYRNDASSVSLGDRSVSFTTQDDAGNDSNTAISTVSVVDASDTTAPAAPSVDLLASSDTGISDSDDLTKDSTPTIRVTLNGSGAEAPIAGDTVQLYEGTDLVGSATLDASDISNGYVDITSSLLTAGNKSFTARVTDQASNQSAASSSLAVEIDLTAPSAIISLDKSSLKSGEIAQVTIAFSEAVNGFANSDLTVPNGSLSSVSSNDGGETWTATFTPSIDIEDTSNVITLADSSVSDAAGNLNSGTTDSSNFTIDTLNPTIAISSNLSSLKAGESATIIFTLSEASSDFSSADVSVSGGTLSGFSGSGTSYSATFTPNANSTTNGVVSVASATFSDAAGNPNQDGADSNNSVTLSVDTLRPVVGSGQTITYSENQSSGAVLGTVSASDSGGIVSYRFSDSGTGVSSDGYFSIDASGQVSLTASGASAGTAVNDYEIGSNSFDYSIQAQDTAGNWSSAETVTLAVTNLNDNAPSISDVTVTLAENSGNGTAVTDLDDAFTSSDLDRDGETLTYSIVGGNNSGAFSIDASTGAITVSDSSQLDYESVASFALTVQASDGVNSDTATVTINLSNLNDNAPSISDVTVTLAENSANGTAVTNLDDAFTGSDLDRDGEALTYSIVGGNDSGAFSIDASTGAITVADSNQLDYESVASFALTVQASDGVNSDTATVTVNLSNLNDNAPSISDVTVTLAENSVNGTAVTNLDDAFTRSDLDRDGEALMYSIVGGNDSGAFSIDASTGAITVADSSQLDYESVASFALTVQASDGVNSDTATVTVNLSNLNDNAPSISDVTVTLAENSANGTAVADLDDAFTGSDLDRDGEALTYSIVGGNDSGAFSIDASTGAIAVADSSQLDYESVASFALTVQASDGVNSDTATVTINLSNLNDNAPSISDVSVTLAENSANGTAVTNLDDVFTGSDFDRDGEALTYSIVGGNDSGAFSIDASTGAITVSDSSQLDYESVASFALTVQASDGVNSDTATVTVNLSNLNDNAPSISDVTVTLVENSANGTAVTNLDDAFTGSDLDRDGEALTYSIVGGNDSGAFSIDASTGAITVADSNQLDYESVASFALTVQASDGVNSDSASVTVNLSNLNDNAPSISDVTVTLAENSVNGTAVTNLDDVFTGSDLDRDGEALTYSIVGGNDSGAFSIDASTGAITVADSNQLDYESVASFALTVQASDGVNSDTASVTVNLSNLNDNAPSISDVTVTLAENSVNGTAVTNLDDVFTGSDLDRDGESLTYSIVGGNDSGAFSIDASTGSITVSDSSQLDYESVTSFALTVQASDGVNSDTASVTVNLSNLNDNAPSTSDVSVTLAENSANGTAVTDLDDVFTGSDFDRDGESLTYSIVGGNDSGAFSIDASTGSITVADSSQLDYESVTSFALTVKASDGVNSDTATVTVSLLDVREEPVVVTIDVIASDDLINIEESLHETTTVSGNVQGGIEPGTTVSVVVNGKTYFGTVDAELHFSVEVDTQELIADGSVTASVEYLDEIGNPQESSGERSVGSDLDVSTPTVDTLIGVDASPTITGTVTLDEGDVFTVSVDGVTYTLGDGSLSIDGEVWTLTIPSDSPLSDGEHEVVATVIDIAGNTKSDLSSKELLIHTQAPEVVDDLAEAKESGGVDNTIEGFDASGNVLDNDSGESIRVSRVTAVDSLEAQTMDIAADGSVTIVGRYGSLTIHADGSFSYQLSEDNQTVEALNPGETLGDRFSYRALDRYGLFNEGQLSITILGTQDDQSVVVIPEPPVITDVIETVVVEVPTPETPATEVADDTPVDDSSGGSSSESLELARQETSSSGDFNAEPQISGASDSQLLSSGTNLQLTIVPGDVPRLMLFRGMPDQFIETGQLVQFNIPSDAFAHTERDAKVLFEAQLTDGTPLPDWLSFDRLSGKFSGTPPSEGLQELSIKVIARDSSGQQVETIFRVHLGNTKSATEGSVGVKQQFRDLAYLSPN